MMKKSVLIIAAMLIFGGMLSAQKSLTFGDEIKLGLPSEKAKFGKVSLYEGQQSLNVQRGYYRSSYTRGCGFVIRPELYRGFYLSLGYQINPFVQPFLSIGVGDGYGLVCSAGARIYTNEGNWAGMIDVRANCDIAYELYGASLVGGASYKDLDFGTGLSFLTNSRKENHLLWVLSVGWNIRCYKHR